VACSWQLLGGMQRLLMVAALAFAACVPHGDVPSGIPSMCTSPDCANNPCAPGCVFIPNNGGCPCAYPTEVATARVTVCANLCGLRTAEGNEESTEPTPAASCSHVDQALSCSVVDSSIEEGGAIVCAEGATCNDGASPSTEVTCPAMS
jgi:hypothetical protein